MAETFNRVSAALGTSASPVYTAPNGATTDRAIVLSAVVANVDGTNAATVHALVADGSSNPITGGKIAHAISVPAGSSLELIANKLVLKNGERFELFASAASDLEVTVSVLEIS